jgi:ubiquinone/menaquinone biosynthesis C-methylase UbiE
VLIPRVPVADLLTPRLDCERRSPTQTARNIHRLRMRTLVTKRQDPEGTEMKTALRHATFVGKDILEIGCGDGRITFSYAGMARKIVAIDPLPESIKMAKEQTPRGLSRKLEFQVGNGEKLRFPDESFDMVFFTWSLCCTDIPSMGKALDEAWRVLKRGGTLINLQPSLHQPFSRGVISYLIQKKFGTSVDDERYAESRRALKYASLVAEKFFPISEEEFTVNTYFDTVDEALDDFTRDRKEQYDRLDPKTKGRIRNVVNSMTGKNGVLTQENAVLTLLSKTSPGLPSK